MSDAPRLQISKVRVICFAVASALIVWLSSYWIESIGLSVAVWAVPCSIAIEYFLGRQSCRERVSRRALLQRVGVLLVCAVVVALAAQRGMRDGNQFLPAHGLTYFWCDWLLKWTSNWSRFAWPPAVAVFISLCAPVLGRSSLNDLPTRSVALLSIFSVLCAIFLVPLVALYVAHPPSAYEYIPLAINIIAVSYLWRTWYVLRGEFDWVKIVLWNMALSGWLFWIAHPWLGEYPRLIGESYSE